MSDETWVEEAVRRKTQIDRASWVWYAREWLRETGYWVAFLGEVPKQMEKWPELTEEILVQAMRDEVNVFLEKLDEGEEENGEE